MPLTAEIPKQQEPQRDPVTLTAAPTPTAPPILDPIVVRAQIIRQRRVLIEKRLQTMAYKRGQLLFEGRWGCSIDVRRTYRRMWLRSLLYVFETALLMALLLGTASFVGLLLALLSGLRLDG